MRISVGLDGQDSAARIRALADGGANDFFAGFVPREWSERFGWEVGLNRRTFGAQSQYTRLDDLGAAMNAARQAGCRFHVTFNAHDYGYERLPLVRDTILSVDRLNPDAYIVADPALMVSMERWGISRPLILSTGAACFNSSTIRFYCSRFDVRRVVIPRKMTVNEMKRLIDAVADLHLDFEAMVIGYRCHFNDELCFSIHSGDMANLCSDFIHGPAVTVKRFPDNWKDVLETALEDPEGQFRPGSPLDRFRAYLRDGLPEELRDHDLQEQGLDSKLAQALFKNCGLCHIPALQRAGVTVVKVPVRGSSWEKMRYLEVVKTVLEHPAPSPDLCRSLVDSAGFCAAPGSCYYAPYPEPGAAEDPWK